MARTQQKRFKFSKGEIRAELGERADNEIFYSSASRIENLVSTPYGSLKTRSGTVNVDELQINSGQVQASITSSIGGTVSDLSDFNNNFISNGIENTTDMLLFDFGGIKNIFITQIKGIKLQFNTSSVKLMAKTFGDTITSIVPQVGEVYPMGVSLNNANIVFPEPENSPGLKATGVLDIDDRGRIFNTRITSGGFGYSSNDYPLAIVSDIPTIELKVAISNDSISWVDIDSYIINNVAQDISIGIKQPFRYLKLYYGGGEAGVLEINNIASYEDQEVKFKLEDFIIDEHVKYLITFSHKQIDVRQNDKLIKTIQVDEILSSMLDDLKVAQEQDTMIICHPLLKTKQLQRFEKSAGVLDWEVTDFPFSEIPYFSFSGEKSEDKTVGITPSSEEGSVTITAVSGVFNANSVGQYIDGNGGRMKIIEYISATKVSGYTIIGFYNKDRINKWKYITGYQKAWSDTKGWPSTCAFYQQRLWLGGSKDAPKTLWASRVDQYNNFKNSNNYKNDAIDVTFSDTRDPINNIYANRGVQVFTGGSEHVMPESRLTPEDIYQVKSSSNGSLKSCSPVDIDGTTLFIEKNGQNLLSFVYDEAQGAYTPSSLSLLSDMIKNPVGMAVDYNSVRNDGNFLYIVNGDGTMVTACILIDQQINSYVRFITDGFIKEVKNVGSDIYIIVQRDAKFYLEKLSPDAKSDNTIKKQVVSKQITGLSNYEDKKVFVYSYKKNYGEFTVSAGSITLPEDIAEDVFVGLPFYCYLKSNKVAVNNKTGSIRSRIAAATIQTYNTNSIDFCGTKRYTSNEKDIFRFAGVSTYKRDTRFIIEGSSIDTIEVLSVNLNINYGSR